MSRLLLLLVLCVALCNVSPTDNDSAALYPTEELVEGLSVQYPQPNAQYKSPLVFRFQLITPDFTAMMDAYTGRRWLCLQLDGVWGRCIPIESGELMIEEMQVGNHTARLALLDSLTPETGKLLIRSEEVAFSILSDEAFAATLKQQHLDDMALYGVDVADNKNVDVVEWFRLQVEKDATTSHVMHEVDAATGEVKPIAERKTGSSFGNPLDPPTLVIAVKTRVVDGFPFRQAIRQTWAGKERLPAKVRVLFAGCRVPADASDQVRQAIAYEQKVYGGDLLTNALDCEDSYATLPQKVKEILHVVGTDHVLRRAAYVMVVDEDVYLRADDLVKQLVDMGPLDNIYAGHVKEGNSFLPERDPQRQYYLPESVYPLDEFPPFAWGPHYLMSMDVVEFIADNREELQGLGPLDDVTIALWLLALQVHPQHLEPFQNLRETPCRNDLIAYADLGPTAMRIIQSNLQSGRKFCFGFNKHTWDKDALT